VWVGFIWLRLGSFNDLVNNKGDKHEDKNGKKKIIKKVW
jgi:hypothetical protein